MTEDETADQEAAENVKSGETTPATVLDHPSFQDFLDKMQEVKMNRLSA